MEARMAKRSDEGHAARAEALFKKQELQGKESEKVWAEHAAAGRAADANKARLTALRLGKAADEGPAKPTRKKHLKAKGYLM
jgi:hypothetical protein